jgi:hypothetical protein
MVASWANRHFAANSMVGKAIVAVLVALAVLSGARGVIHALHGSGDFGITLKVWEFLQRENPYARFFAEGWIYAPPRSENPHTMVPSQAPSAIMLLWPYGLLSWPAARIAWLVSNLIFTAGIIVLGCRRYLRDRSVWLHIAIGSLFIIGTPWRNLMTNGQHLLAGLFFFMLAMELADRKRNLFAGLALAASFIKYTTTLVLVPYLIFKRQWTPIAVALGVHAAMTLWASLWLQENPFVLLVQSVQAGGSANAFEGFLDLFALSKLLGIAPTVAIAVSAVLLVMSISLACRRGTDGDLLLAMLCFLSMVLVYHRYYDLVVLVVPLLIAVQRGKEARLMPVLVFLCVLILWLGDRPVYFLTDWFRAKDNPFFLAVAGLWYGTLAVLFYQAWAAASARAAPARSPR